jgi:hypothetical protein
VPASRSRPPLTSGNRLEQLIDRLEAAFGTGPVRLPSGAIDHSTTINGPWPWWGHRSIVMWRFPCPVCLGGTRGWAIDGPWRPLVVLSNGDVWCEASLPMSPEMDQGFRCRLTPDAPPSALLEYLELWERT